jgi:hypothetical protein
VKIRPAIFLVIGAALLVMRMGCQAFGQLMKDTSVEIADHKMLTERWQDVLAVSPGETCADGQAFTARADFIVPDTPDSRYELAAYYYLDSGLGYGAGIGYGYGQGQMDFTSWELRRGVLAGTTGSRWWRDVNGHLLRDMLEAHFLYAAGLGDCGGSNTAVDAWLAFLHEPSSMNWYLAHNASIVRGYQVSENLAFEEDISERIVMANTLYRVSLADFLVAEAEPFIADFSNPRGPAVHLITAVAEFYPMNYPLTSDDAEKAASLYLLEGNTIVYAGVTQRSVVNYLLSTGMSQRKVNRLRPDVNLYQELFPGFNPPPGRIAEP